MTNPTPRDSAQLPPHFLQAGVFSGEHHKWVIDYAERYAREALSAQAASSPATAVDAVDAQVEAVIEASDGRWHDGEFRIDGSDLSTLIRAALQASRQPQPQAQQGGGEVVAWQSADGGGSFVSHQAHEQHRGYRTLYTIPLVRAGQVAAPAMVELSEAQLTACLLQSSCIGTVKMSFESGPYEIDRPSINADRLCRAIESASAKLNGLTVGGIQASGRAE